MNKILLRIFISLASIITLLGFFVTVVVSVTNDVRKEHYFHELIKAPISYFSSHPFQSSVVEVIEYDLLSELTDEFNGVAAERLHYGQVVLMDDHDRFLALKAVDDKRVAVLGFNGVGAQVYTLYSEVVQEALMRSGDVSDVVAALSAALGVQVRKVTAGNELDRQELLDGLVERGVYNDINSDGQVKNTFVRLVSGEVYVVHFDDYYSSFSWWLFFFLMLISIAVVMLVAYYFVEGFSRRLRAIESAASRLSRGELEARVAKAGDEDAISRLGLAFNSMADHIQRLMYVQKEMIHAVSHELRTPVARIRFGVQMIEDCPSPEAMSKQVKGIDGDIQELDELIDEILTYARLEQGGPILAIQEADVAAIVEQVISEQSSVKPDMEIFAEFKDGSDVWKISEVETRYIHRSIQNLVGNATRYANGRVKVVCSFDAETCRIDVEDDGPGIPEDQWESVFTPFARLDDSRTRSSGGYGLGLSIVRRILYWHGGQAFLGRSDLGGAKFSLVWPRRQEKS